MTPGTKIVIDRISYDGEFKKYPSTQEQIQRNEREKIVQRERDERIRNQVNNSQGSNGSGETAHQRVG